MTDPRCITGLEVETRRGRKSVMIHLDGEEWAKLDPETVVLEKPV